MSYLKFEKALMTNLEEALPRELIRTNRSGAYSSFLFLNWTTKITCCYLRSMLPSYNMVQSSILVFTSIRATISARMDTNTFGSLTVEKCLQRFTALEV